jgi:hemerythrin
MSKRSRNNNSNSNTLSTATSKRTKIFGNKFFKQINKHFNINNVMKQIGYNNPTPKKTKKPRKQSTPKKSPNK